MQIKAILLVAKPFIEPVEMNGTPATEALPFELRV